MNGLNRASWERVAHELTHDNASDIEVAERLECRTDYIARVRSDLGMEEYPRPLVTAGASAAAVFAANATLLEGGHRQWKGRVSRDGTPLFSNVETVNRVSFRLTYGTEPQGQVRVDCEWPHCVAGDHLTDRLMRKARRGDR